MELDFIHAGELKNHLLDMSPEDKTLKLANCELSNEDISALPTHIEQLSFMSVSGCKTLNLVEFHELVTLSLSRTGVHTLELPKGLVELSLLTCGHLNKICAFPHSLEKLEIAACFSLSKLPEIPSHTNGHIMFVEGSRLDVEVGKARLLFGTNAD